MTPPLSGRLRGSWEDAWTGLRLTAPAGVLSDLLDRYTEAHRAYHTLQHLGECFAALEPASAMAQRLSEVQLALWFHDAVYDTRAHDNEEQSSQLAQAALRAAGAGAETAARVHALIAATTHRDPPEPGDAQLVVDVDLSILGAAADRFAEYEAQIRQEYAWVEAAEFRRRRAQVLAGFLERPSIYGTAVFARRLEARARANLSRSLGELSARAPS